MTLLRGYTLLNPNHCNLFFPASIRIWVSWSTSGLRRDEISVSRFSFRDRGCKPVLLSFLIACFAPEWRSDDDSPPNGRVWRCSDVRRVTSLV
jgi:hypothetical protein